jgi:predicted nicotinamide N-methyase
VLEHHFSEIINLCPLQPVQLCPELLAHQATDLFCVWEKLEADSDAASVPPFWATVWPGAALLARLLLDEPQRVYGRRVWDLGCGGGIAGIAAARAGAKRVIANDVDEVALQVSGANATANGVSIETRAGDMFQYLSEFEARDVVLVAEMFYEQSPSLLLLKALHGLVERGGQVLIADGGRPFAPQATHTPLREARLTVPKLVEGAAFRDVRVFALGHS